MPVCTWKGIHKLVSFHSDNQVFEIHYHKEGGNERLTIANYTKERTLVRVNEGGKTGKIVEKFANPNWNLISVPTKIWFREKLAAKRMKPKPSHK